MNIPKHINTKVQDITHNMNEQMKVALMIKLSVVANL